LLGLYDSHGVLRYAGRDRDDCLAYAELFDLDDAAFTLEPLAVRVTDPAASAGADALQPL
jgi:hypothetical protein